MKKIYVIFLIIISSHFSKAQDLTARRILDINNNLKKVEKNIDKLDERIKNEREPSLQEVKDEQIKLRNWYRVNLDLYLQLLQTQKKILNKIEKNIDYCKSQKEFSNYTFAVCFQPFFNSPILSSHFIEITKNNNAKKRLNKILNLLTELQKTENTICIIPINKNKISSITDISDLDLKTYSDLDLITAIFLPNVENLFTHSTNLDSTIIYFDFNSSKVKNKSNFELIMKKMVVDTVELLAKNELIDSIKVRIKYIGYTDGVGNDDYNLKLSKNRAEEAKNIATKFLQSALNNKSIVSIKTFSDGHGKEFPPDYKQTGSPAQIRNDFKRRVCRVSIFIKSYRNWK